MYSAFSVVRGTDCPMVWKLKLSGNVNYENLNGGTLYFSLREYVNSPTIKLQKIAYPTDENGAITLLPEDTANIVLPNDMGYFNFEFVSSGGTQYAGKPRVLVLIPNMTG